MVMPGPESSRINALVGLLNEIADMHAELLASIDRKIEAMRSADTERIRDAMMNEKQIVDRINEREGLRKQLTVNIARSFGVGAERVRRMSAKQLAERFAGPDSVRIDRAVERMRELTGQIGRRNHVAQLISQNILRHMRIVFASMTAPANGGVAYSPDGHANATTNERIFDLVG